MSSRPILDLAKRHSVYKHGDITVIMTWLATTARPCLVLVPTFTMPTSERVTPVIISIDTAYLWDGHPENHAHCVGSAFGFADSLGLNAMDQKQVHRVIGIIQGHVGDLVIMPPRPDTDHRIVADAFRSNQATGEIIHSEITDHV